MAYKKPRAPKTAYVPRVVFAVAVAAVVPSLAPASCGSGPVGVACTSFCGVAAVAMGGFGGVAAVAMGGFGGVGGNSGGGGTSPTGTGGAGGSGGTATGTGGSAGAGGTAAFTMPADPRAAESLADAAPKKSPRAPRSRKRG